MPISVEGPNGELVEFPDGTSPEVMQRAMAAQFGSGTNQATIAAGPQSQDGRQNASRLASAIGGASQGITFGFGDEIEAGLASLIPIDRLVDVGGNADIRFGDFKGNLEQIRERNKNQRESNPKTFLGGEIAGGGAFGGVGAGRVAAAKTTGAAAREGAKLGAAGGALFGAGTAEGGLVERAKGAAQGAAIGGATGGVLTPVARSLGTAISNFKTRPKNAKLSRADEIILKEVQKNNNISRDEAIKLLTNTDADSPQLLFQKLGLERLAQGSATPGGRSGKIFEQAIRQQQRNQQARISEGVKRIIGADDFTSLSNDIAENLRTQGKELYQQAFAAPFQATPKLGELLQRPAGKRAAAIAARNSANKGDRGQAGLAFFQEVKEGLDDVISSSFRQGKNKQGQAALSLQRELLDELDSIVPSYRDARNLWAGQKANEAALQFGRKSLNMDPQDVATQAAQYSQGERQHALAGILRAVDDRLSRASTSNDASKRFSAERVRNVFRAVLPEEQANRITSLLDAESRLTETGRLVRPSSGSQTAPRQQSVDAVARLSSGPARRVIGGVIENGAAPIQSAKRYLKVVAKEATRQDANVIEALAVRLAGTPEEAAQVFSRLSTESQGKVQTIYNRAGGVGPFLIGESSNSVSQSLSSPTQ